MKPLYAALIAAAAVTAVAVCLTACRKKPDTDPIDGGVRHYIDENAPKVIRSTEIVSFQCKFSTLHMLREESELAGNVYELQATAEGGCYGLRVGEGGSFSPDADFFARLQAIVAENDLAQYNGIFHTVSGLPPDCGAELWVEYASGETIRSSDNQDCFLSVKAMTELKELFRLACENS